MVEQLKHFINERNQCFVEDRQLETAYIRADECESLARKKQALKHRKAEIVKASIEGQVIRQQRIDDEAEIDYLLHHQFLIKNKEKFYMEELLQHRRALFVNEELADDFEVIEDSVVESPQIERLNQSEQKERFSYNRLEAVRYAERWWNDYNPIYRRFENNCTNFVSQCLRAGGAPMSGASNRSKGWWYREENWSYSWSVAHAMRWYLSGAESGLRGQEMSSAKELSPGDVICYDFDGDGRWQHTTIVVAKDADGMPLVNAQTTNSRMRYWTYEDSTAWTEHINYRFFHIAD
ncbi:amidase domain-containing protein [Desertibacillus haloalkaliphilus]|uniref:amidase domain-containing protein n=1 Tax=Desertibacillus haloalkaliphilus TaxID=1328930 RepID=UPI001C259C0F|nr:amidase domain-containing protein [Desertibacillus haloalkaliphilus]